MGGCDTMSLTWCFGRQNIEALTARATARNLVHDRECTVRHSERELRHNASLGDGTGPGACDNFTRSESPSTQATAPRLRPLFDGSVVRKPSPTHFHHHHPAHDEPISRETRAQCRSPGQKAQRDPKSEVRNPMARKGTQEATGGHARAMGVQTNRHAAHNVGE